MRQKIYGKTRRPDILTDGRFRVKLKYEITSQSAKKSTEGKKNVEKKKHGTTSQQEKSTDRRFRVNPNYGKINWLDESADGEYVKQKHGKIFGQIHRPTGGMCRAKNWNNDSAR